MRTLIIALVAYGIGMFPFYGWWRGRRINGKAIMHTGPLQDVVLWVVLEMTKGALAVLIGWAMGGWFGASVAALLVVMGRLFPVVPAFRSGGGTAVAAGALFVLSPMLIAMGILVYLVSVLLTRYLGISTILTVVAVMILSVVISAQLYVIIVAVCVGSLILYHQTTRRFGGWKNPFRFRRL
jgi:glycerol-3-phosphate acyltransferase PlsY